MSTALVMRCFLALVLLGTPSTFAQAPPLRFEVASVKLREPNPGTPGEGVVVTPPRIGGGRVRLTLHLRGLVRMAYGIDERHLVGGPTWQTSRLFDIDATLANPNATPSEINEMLKSLLADRFQLRVHHETRETQISELVLARADRRLGPSLKPSTLTCPTPEEQLALLADAAAKNVALANGPCNRVVLSTGRVEGQPLSTLLPLLSRLTGSVVQDRTGLTGRFDWDLAFDARPLSANADTPAPDRPSIRTALEEQLGLKLQSATGQVQVLVIDGAEPPSPN